MHSILHSIFKFFASLRLTVVTLTLALILVFVGTIAQVKMGLYLAQQEFFSSMLIYWSPKGSDWRIPVFPGGYLLGAVLLLNLIAAHFDRWSPSKKKIGISIIHAGLVVMFLGQFTTQVLQVESYMAIPEGGSRNFSESGRRSELAVIDVTDPKADKVVAIPERMLEKRAKGGEITHPDLPFAIKVKDYKLNSSPRIVGKEIGFEGVARATKMNDRDVPAATVEVVAKGAPATEWTVSNWLVEEKLVSFMKGQFARMGTRVPAEAEGPKQFEFNGRTYLLAMRPERYYKPFHLSLKEFKFDRYLGTGIAKNYSSQVRIQRPETGEDREVLIYMNNPLRYWGETYYQGGFFEDESGTILQVVRNPSWLTPYVACVMVGTGLLVQFLGHLIGFARKRSA